VAVTATLRLLQETTLYMLVVVWVTYHLAGVIMAPLRRYMTSRGRVVNLCQSLMQLAFQVVLV